MQEINDEEVWPVSVGVRPLQMRFSPGLGRTYQFLHAYLGERSMLASA